MMKEQRLLKFKEFCELYENSDIVASISRLQNALSGVNAVDDKAKEHIRTKIDDTSEYVEKFEQISDVKRVFVETKNFSEADFERIKTVIQKDSEESLNALTKYLQTPYDQSYFIGTNVPTNLPAKMSKDTGISESTLKLLFAMDGNMKSGKGVGRGELFLGLMINGAANSAEGDVNIGGKKYEVKAKDARLNTQNGFGGGEAAMISFIESLSTISPDLQQKYGSIDKKSIQSFNLGKSSSFYDLFIDVAKLKKLDELFELIANTVFCGKFGIWKNGDAKIKKAVVDNLKAHVSRNGQCDYKALNYGFMYVNILYYQSIEWFEGIFLIDPKGGSFAFFNPQDPKMGATWLSKNTKYQQPSWQDAPTSNCWKISI